jgi:hypothetical protein
MSNTITVEVGTYMPKVERIQAIQYTGRNAHEIALFAGKSCDIRIFTSDLSIAIKSKHGIASVVVGSYVVDKLGGFEVCSEKIFEAAYKFESSDTVKCEIGGTNE